MTNPMGLYKALYRGHKDGKKGIVVGYYATSPNTLPRVPGGTRNGITTLLVSCQEKLGVRVQKKSKKKKKKIYVYLRKD
jgi:hypothetical protein